MSEVVGRRALVTAGLALGAVPVVSSAFGGTAHASENAPLIGPAKGDRLHVMSFNVRVPVDQPPHSWADRRPLISDLLNLELPTILGTQEGIFGQLQDIRADLPNRYDWIHLFREGGSKGESMAIIYDSVRLKPIAYDHLWLSDTPYLIGSKTWGNTVVRMLTWVRFLDNRTGKEFIHLNTHFDHQSEESRVRSAQMVHDVVAGFDVPTIVTGDFNTPHETSESYQILVTEGGLRDTWVDAGQRLTPEYKTFNGWQPAVEDGDRIDWALCTEGTTVSKAAINVGPGGGLYPSDHWPVQALVQLP